MFSRYARIEANFLALTNINHALMQGFNEKEVFNKDKKKINEIHKHKNKKQ